MNSLNQWQQDFQKKLGRWNRAITLDHALSREELRDMTGEEPPSYVLELCQQWHLDHSDPWQVVTRTIEVQYPDNLQAITQELPAHPLRRLIEQAQQAVIVWHPSRVENWSCVLILPPRQRGYPPGYLKLFEPATSAEIAAAEAVLGMALPPSYQDLLLVTNGLGFSPSGVTQVMGAGPKRALWDVVLRGDWLSCEAYEEVAAQWRFFQGGYADLRTQEQDIIFHTDETVLVPFLVIEDVYCFDRSRPDLSGECPIVFWDHEDLGGCDVAPTFRHWLEEELEERVF